MRYAPVLFAILPSLAWAEDIPLQSAVSAVTLYPQGATITREVAFSAPVGAHELILTDLPQNVPLERVRVRVDGVTMGNVTLRNDYLPPVDPNQISAIQGIEDQIDDLELALQRHDDEIDLLRTEVAAAEARVAFLKQVGQGDGVVSLGVDGLRELSGMIGEETLTALKQAHEAALRVTKAQGSRDDTEEDLARARQLLKSMQPAIGDDRAMLALAITSEAAVEGRAVITYTIDDAGWTPTYDVKLTRATGALSIERGAFVNQHSGENWQDVALTLSTSRPSEQMAPGEVWPWLRRMFDPEDALPRPLLERAEADMAVIVEEPAVFSGAVKMAEASSDSLSVSYTYPGTVDVANQADRVRIVLGRLDMQADLSAQAVPLSDQSAFLMAQITNTSEELILPTWEAMFYLDGRFVGQNPVDLIPAGGEADLSFGPIDGLRLSRMIVDRREGDRGVITKSNEASEHARLTVENLTGESWPIRLLDRVPYSEQDDLRITWEADLAPTEQNVDDKRGVMAWEFELPAGGTKEINLTHRIDWPEGKTLQ